MTLDTKKWIVAGTALAVLLMFGAAFASNPVQVTVNDADGRPVEGIRVDVFGSADSKSAVTDARGRIEVQIHGRAFRLRVDGRSLENAYKIEDGPVTVSACDADFDTAIAVYESFCPAVANQAIA